MQALANRDIDPDDIATVAELFPDLRPAVAAHPAAYPELLDWLAGIGDPTIALIIGSRPSPQSAPAAPVTPAATSNSADQPVESPTPVNATSPQFYTAAPQRRLAVQPIVIILAVIAVVVAGVLLFLLLNLGDDDPTDTPTGPVTDPTATGTATQTTSEPPPAYPTDADGNVQPNEPLTEVAYAVVSGEGGAALVHAPTGLSAPYDTSVFGTIPRYEAVKLLGTHSDITGWTFVEYVSYGTEMAPVTGWAENSALQRPEKPLVQPDWRINEGQYAVVSPQAGLNLRTGPSADYDVLLTIPQHTEVAEHGYSSSNHDWVFIRYENIEGWVAAQYLETP
jgi:hypothetical protein